MGTACDVLCCLYLTFEFIPPPPKFSVTSVSHSWSHCTGTPPALPPHPRAWDVTVQGHPGPTPLLVTSSGQTGDLFKFGYLTTVPFLLFYDRPPTKFWKDKVFSHVCLFTRKSLRDPLPPTHMGTPSLYPGPHTQMGDLPYGSNQTCSNLFTLEPTPHHGPVHLGPPSTRFSSNLYTLESGRLANERKTFLFNLIYLVILWLESLYLY